MFSLICLLISPMFLVHHHAAANYLADNHENDKNTPNRDRLMEIWYMLYDQIHYGNPTTSWSRDQESLDILLRMKEIEDSLSLYKYLPGPSNEAVKKAQNTDSIMTNELNEPLDQQSSPEVLTDDRSVGKMNRQSRLVNHASLTKEFCTDRSFGSCRTITDVLLQTFDHEGSDCHPQFFKYMDDLNSGFAKTRIVGVLKDNRKVHFRDCWLKLMQTFEANLSIFGKKRRDKIDTIVSNVSGEELIKSMIPDGSSDPESIKDLETISSKVAEFIAEDVIEHSKKERRHPEDINKYLESQLLIKKTCDELLSATNPVMGLIYPFLRDPQSESIVEEEDVELINTNLVCKRISEDIDKISDHVMHLIHQAGIQKLSQPSTTEPMQIDGSLIKNNIALLAH